MFFQHLIRVPEMMKDKSLEDRLYEIVLRHTVVGGYPDCRAVARDAYALAMADADAIKNQASSESALMQMERTVWIGGSCETEHLDMDAWIKAAEQEDFENLDHLLKHDLVVTSDDDQRLLADVWRSASYDLEIEPNMHEDSPSDMVTYHWGEGERLALRRVVQMLRPEALAADPLQGSLL